MRPLPRICRRHVTGLLTCFAVALLSSSASSAAASSAAELQQESTQLLSDVKSDIAYIKASVWNFWAAYGPDPVFGGFHGTVARDGSPVSPAYKGIVQTARHAWAFSEFHRHGITKAAPAPFQLNPLASKITQEAGSKPLPTSLQMAEMAYKFMMKYMKDPKDSMFYWSVSRDGKQVVHANKCLYAQLFAIHGLSNYYTAFGDAQAKQDASDCFRSIDARWYNSTTGRYQHLGVHDDSYNEFYSNGVSIADDPNAATAKDYITASTANVLMHAIEALESLHRITKDSTVLKRMLKLMDIICNKLVRSNGHLFGDYVPSVIDGVWQPAKGAVVSYGHSLEACWLLANTVQYLLLIKALSQETATAYTATLMAIGDAALRDGYDSMYGGVFELGTPTTVTSTVKVWWVQTEAIQAIWRLYQYHNKQDEDYLRKMAKSVQFLKTFVTDRVYGEQFWEVAQDGNFQIKYVPGSSIKGNRWKASYHNSRAVLNLEQWTG